MIKQEKSVEFLIDYIKLITGFIELKSFSLQATMTEKLNTKLDKLHR